MSASANISRNRQMIAAGNAGWRVQHNGLTHRIALRVQRFLHAQRAAMTVFTQH